MRKISPGRARGKIEKTLGIIGCTAQRSGETPMLAKKLWMIQAGIGGKGPRDAA